MNILETCKVHSQNNFSWLIILTIIYFIQLVMFQTSLEMIKIILPNIAFSVFYIFIF